MEIDGLKKELAQFHGESFVWALNCCHGNREDAADVLQTVYLKVLQRRARFDGRSPFKVWLFAVIRRTAADFYRRRSGYRRLLHRFAGEAPETAAGPQLADGERDGMLEQALQSLSERQRTVLQLVFYHRLTVEAAARVMGVGTGTARMHYARAKQNLRKALERMGWHDVVEAD